MYGTIKDTVVPRPIVLSHVIAGQVRTWPGVLLTRSNLAGVRHRATFNCFQLPYNAAGGAAPRRHKKNCIHQSFRVLSIPFFSMSEFIFRTRLLFGYYAKVQRHSIPQVGGIKYTHTFFLVVWRVIILKSNTTYICIESAVSSFQSKK